MGVNRRALWFVLISSFALIAGCELEADISSAKSRVDGSEEVISVLVSEKDAKSIKARQIYFSLVAVECSTGANEYPMLPNADGRGLRRFDFDVPKNGLEVYGKMPSDIFQKYSSVCVSLRGGGYLSGKISSPLIPVIRY